MIADCCNVSFIIWTIVVIVIKIVKQRVGDCNDWFVKGLKKRTISKFLLN